MKHLISICAALILTAGLLTAEDATKLTADDIVRNANHAAYYKGKDGSAKISMVIKDRQGRKRSREFSILRWDQPSPENAADDKWCGDQKMFVYFKLPADVNKMVFLVWKHLGSNDDRWLYLPALDLIKRIASSEKRTSFVGSNFYYEDVSGRSMTDDTHELLETTKDYYILKNVPKDPASVEFAWYKVWIHRATFLPIKTEYYNTDKKAIRRYTALNVETIQNYPTVTKAKMEDLQTGGETMMTYSNIKFNIDIPEKIFSERYLRKAPRKYLR